MALDGDALGELIKTDIDVVVAAAIAAKTSVDRDDLYKAMGNAIVNYLVANTLVLPTALVAPSGGGPVTGTGLIS